jgi:hypothetical protein
LEGWHFLQARKIKIDIFNNVSSSKDQTISFKKYNYLSILILSKCIVPFSVKKFEVIFALPLQKHCRHFTGKVKVKIFPESWLS